MPVELGRCWSCQREIRQKNAVWIDEDESLPCCKTCWRRVPIARRLEIALKFQDRSDRGLGWAETLTAIRELIHSSFGNYIERRLSEDNQN